MAYTLELRTSDILTPDQALELAGASIDPTSIESLVEHAWILQALGNNRTFLGEVVNQDIKDAIEGHQTRIYTPQSIILTQNDNFTLRANFWVVPTTDNARHDLEVSLYSYNTAHDHNFDFLTFGYFGPGYRTDIYEYDRGRVRGLVGEKVELAFLGTTTLETGKTIGFRGGRDVHIQYPPPGFSISLNLICRDPLQLRQPQYFFDTDKKCIIGHVNNAVTGRFSLLRFAKYVGNGETVELLDRIRGSQDQPLLRAAAYDALLQLSAPEDRERISLEMSRDNDPDIARRIELLREFSP
jgi:hypothetical protein